MGSRSESDPCYTAFAITPSDTAYLQKATRAIYVGGAGDVVVKMQEQTTAVTFVGVPAGMILPIKAEQVKATGTTATNLVGMY